MGRKKSGKQDYNTMYIVGGIVVAAALFFSGGSEDPPAVEQKSTQRRSVKKSTSRRLVGGGTEVYLPWYTKPDTAAWVNSDSAWLDAVDGGNSSSVFAACDLENILSEIPTPGFHVLCTMPITHEEAKTSATRVAVFNKGSRAPTAHTSFLIPKDMIDNNDVSSLINFMSFKLSFRQKPENYQRMAFFTKRGRRLREPSNVFKRAQVLVYEGGQWIWPGVRIGHTVKLPGLRRKGEQTEIVTVALQPKIFEIKNFLKTSEADHIVKMAGPHVAKSGVSVKDVDKDKAAADGVDQWRTSLTHFYNSYKDEVMVGVEKRVQALTRVNISHAEDTQVLRYDLNGRYLAHHDFFDPKDYSGAQEQQMIHAGAKNRMATVFFYLNTVPKGGETGFPRANDMAGIHPSTYDRCDIGYQSKAEKNKVIIFYSMHPDGSLDKDSLHGGCPVKEGEKWSANFWLWNKQQSFGRDGPGKTRVSHEDPLDYEDISLDPEAKQQIM